MKTNLMATLRTVDLEKLDEELDLVEYKIKKNEKKSLSKRFNKLNKQHTREMGRTETIL